MVSRACIFEHDAVGVSGIYGAIHVFCINFEVGISSGKMNASTSHLAAFTSHNLLYKMVSVWFQIVWEFCCDEHVLC